MKRLLFCLALMAIACNWALSQAPQPAANAAPAGDVVIGSGSFSPIVWDLERSLKFYSDLVGSPAPGRATAGNGLIAVESDVLGPPQIWLMRADGSEARWFADGAAPAWSSDGTRLVYLTPDRAGIVSYLEVVDASREALLTERANAQLAGQRLNMAVQLIKSLGGGWSEAQLFAKGSAAPTNRR